MATRSCLIEAYEYMKHNVDYVEVCKVKYLEKLSMHRSLICNKQT